ncbi:MAG: hypothetical protein JOZ74_14820 [Bradyrhizobium sp.]|nr:hypothetical protein [Bradyrhizobium sp.]
MSVERLKQRAVNIACQGSHTLDRWYDPQGELRTLASPKQSVGAPP